MVTHSKRNQADKWKRLNVSQLDSLDPSFSFKTQLLDHFKQSYTKSLAILKQGLESGNKEDSLFGSHDIKGSSVTIGLDTVSQAAAQIEQLCKDGNLTEAKRHIGLLESETKYGIQIFEEYLSSMPTKDKQV